MDVSNKLNTIISYMEELVNVEYDTLQEEINKFREHYNIYEKVFLLERSNLSSKEISEFEQRAKSANEKFWEIRQI